MAEGGNWSKASGDGDELFSIASADADELFSKASADADELFSEASGDADESFCDPCKSDGESKAAEGYCQVCNEYLCETCLGVHKKLKLTKTHEIRTLTKEREQMTREAPSIDTAATFNRSINVKCESDQNACGIGDCALLSKDRMVVIDWMNNNVKLVDINNNSVISIYSTPSTPYCATALSTNMIAVTLHKCTIEVLNVTSTFALQREMEVKSKCRGIAYKDGKLAVSYVDPGKVEILDTHSKILHTIQPKQGKENVLQCPNYVIFGKDNDTVIVSDNRTEDISVVTFEGLILRTYTPDKYFSPRGIVMTANGVLFVCSDDRCIHVVSPDFKTSKIIINKDKHVVHPGSITYCEISHTLYISNTSTFLIGGIYDQIQVYDLNA